VLDPDAAERVINAVLGHGSLRDLDRESVTRAKLVLLAAIVADARLDDAALDEFLAARTEDESKDAERGFLTLSRTDHLDGIERQRYRTAGLAAGASAASVD
jgi:hypothetical protein